ncbi:hypothetical protein FRACA_1730001 [Frankia canadensis]|uniref:Uncharacterized protein n=1 Tax=Frankia canadensis TaxID=1836972 RepID=A0A2I2KNA9_9ACTN|nr:hypothetical protein FRACA_1730001 [Frankia canadensis]SOU54444.1 hypothetical protein FRACA_1730001 [Frankia canadensis]
MRRSGDPSAGTRACETDGQRVELVADLARAGAVRRGPGAGSGPERIRRRPASGCCD